MVLERNHEFCIGCILELVLQYKCLHHLQPVKPFFRQNREYLAGLFLTYLGLYLMNGNGQPALLYLVPCTLGVTVVLAAIRGDLKALWGYSSKSSAMINPTAEV
ncbi:hypothetical protein Gorai_005976 [Gossypium raimondii]|uniref:Uncharacterized protein n=1 Tax=Gossypium raimondii TaxID=29730 RepID=A0A7J8QER9_GOSRA|nr:hypothetical protein [Gossypium raimondii]